MHTFHLYFLFIAINFLYVFCILTSAALQVNKYVADLVCIQLADWVCVLPVTGLLLRIANGRCLPPSVLFGAQGRWNLTSYGLMCCGPCFKAGKKQKCDERQSCQPSSIECVWHPACANSWVERMRTQESEAKSTK